MKKIIKKDGAREAYDFNKIVLAIGKSADRVNKQFTESELTKISNYVDNELSKIDAEEIPVAKMHSIVECALDNVSESVAKSYRDYRNYKIDLAGTMDDIFQASRDIKYIADKDNANTDSTLVSTQRSLTVKVLSKEIYKKFYLTEEERRDVKDGYYYIHDLADRFFTMNCCLFDIGHVMKDGFEMANMYYTEPTEVRSAMSVAADITMSAAAQQYGRR